MLLFGDYFYFDFIFTDDGWLIKVAHKCLAGLSASKATYELAGENALPATTALLLR